MRKQQGAVTLVMAVVILAAMSVFSFMSVQYASTEQKMYANHFQSEQALESAQAGLDYGSNYLQKNRASIVVDSDADGYIDESSVSMNLSNGASFTVVYTNPIANNFDVIHIASTGLSSDTAASRNAAKLVNLSDWVAYVPSVSVALTQGVELRGSATITNDKTDTTIWSGGDAKFKGKAKTVTSSGVSSSAKRNGPDLITDDSALANMTKDDYFKNFFGLTETQLKNSADIVVTDEDKGSYGNIVDGVTRKLIWLENTKDDGKVNLTDGPVIGSPSDPVVLIINGEATISGGTEIYGVVYIAGDWASGGGRGGVGVVIHGAVISHGVIDLGSGVEIYYSPEVLDNLGNNGLYSTVVSSWNDMGY